MTRNHDDQGVDTDQGSSGLAADVNTKLDNGTGLDLYHRDDELQEKTLEHFQLNLKKKVPNHRPKLYQSKEKMLRTVI